MNERILELRKQAINCCLDKGSQGNLSEEVSEKFAQLIVQECIRVSDETGTSSLISDRIAERFGFRS